MENMSPPRPDQVDRQIARIRTLLADLEATYRLAYEVGYSCVQARDGIRRGRAATADPTASTALAGALQDERQLVGAAATRIKEAQRALQGAVRDARDALRIVADAGVDASSEGGGPLVTRAELEALRGIRARHEGAQERGRRDLRNGQWVDLA
jgi:hypothetical protein